MLMSRCLLASLQLEQTSPEKSSLWIKQICMA